MAPLCLFQVPCSPPSSSLSAESDLPHGLHPYIGPNYSHLPSPSPGGSPSLDPSAALLGSASSQALHSDTAFRSGHRLLGPLSRLRSPKSVDPSSFHSHPSPKNLPPLRPGPPCHHHLLCGFHLAAACSPLPEAASQHKAKPSSAALVMAKALVCINTTFPPVCPSSCINATFRESLEIFTADGMPRGSHTQPPRYRPRSSPNSSPAGGLLDCLLQRGSSADENQLGSLTFTLQSPPAGRAPGLATRAEGRFPSSLSEHKKQRFSKTIPSMGRKGPDHGPDGGKTPGVSLGVEDPPDERRCVQRDTAGLGGPWRLSHSRLSPQGSPHRRPPRIASQTLPEVPKFVHQISFCIDETDHSCLRALLHLRNMKGGITSTRVRRSSSSSSSNATRSCSLGRRRCKGKTGGSCEEEEESEKDQDGLVPKPKILFQLPSHHHQQLKSNGTKPPVTSCAEQAFQQPQRAPAGGIATRPSTQPKQKVIVHWSDGMTEEFDPTGLEVDQILKNCYHPPSPTPS